MSVITQHARARHYIGHMRRLPLYDRRSCRPLTARPAMQQKMNSSTNDILIMQANNVCPDEQHHERARLSFSELSMPAQRSGPLETI